MRSTGAEQPVVGVKVLKWDWTEGAASFSRGPGPTGNGRSPVAEAKPLDVRSNGRAPARGFHALTNTPLAGACGTPARSEIDLPCEGSASECGFALTDAASVFG